MDFDLPEQIKVVSRAGDRLILGRSTGDSEEFVTIDFEWRRWQLGNHPHKVLNFVSTPPKGRNWRKELVRDATGALLSTPWAGNPGRNPQEDASALLTEEDQEAPATVTVSSSEATAVPAAVPPSLPGGAPMEPLPEVMTAYAWKRLQDGQLSQDINAPTPEALFVLAGFRPYRVTDPIQGFLCVPVQRRGDQWIEVKEP